MGGSDTARVTSISCRTPHGAMNDPCTTGPCASCLLPRLSTMWESHVPQNRYDCAPRPGVYANSLNSEFNTPNERTSGGTACASLVDAGRKVAASGWTATENGR